MNVNNDSATPVHRFRGVAAAMLADHGMLLVLGLLCLFFSVVTLDEQTPAGGEAAQQLVASLPQASAEGGRLMVVAGRGGDEDAFAASLAEQAAAAGWQVVAV